MNHHRIDVTYPSPVPPYGWITDSVTRREFQARMSGSPVAVNLAGSQARAVELRDVEEVMRWFFSRGQVTR